MRKEAKFNFLILAVFAREFFVSHKQSPFFLELAYIPKFLCMHVQAGVTMAEVPFRRVSRIVSREAH